MVLASDGVWDSMDANAVIRVAAKHKSIETAAMKVVETAIGNGSDDNVSAYVLRL